MMRNRVRATGLAVLGSVAMLCLLPSAASALDPVVCVDEGVFVQPPLAPPVVALGVPGPGEVYEGATPPGLEPDRPVLVFVHGLHGNVNSWIGETEYYGRNDMYDTAYASGYKTFFVELWDAEAESTTAIENGFLLRRLLSWISETWGVSRVNLVAHSKGGPDANVAALVSEGLVDRIFTLSGAHWGSPLADLAQSSWGGWLAELLGYNDPGTKFLQTACMQWFRGMADWRPFNNRYSIFTAAATGWGPALSALGFGGAYLAGACPGSGDNDGLVCIDHAEHPWARDPGGSVTGQHRLIWDVGGPDYEADHDNVRMGNAFMDFTWPWEPDDCYIPIFESIEPYIGVHSPAAPGPAPAAHSVAAAPQADLSRQLVTLVRGGAIEEEGSADAFPVESGVERLALRLLVVDPGTRARLRSPEGRLFELPAPRRGGDQFFQGAWSTGLDLERPAAGEWRLELTSSDPGAYLLVGLLDSPLRLRLDVEREQGRYLVSAVGGDAVWLSLVARGAQSALSSVVTEREMTARGRHLELVATDGVQNLSVSVRGVDGEGVVFERNVALTVGPATSRPEMIPGFCK